MARHLMSIVSVYVVTLTAAIPFSEAHAQPNESARPLELSSSIGALFPGSYTVENGFSRSLDSDAGFIGRIGADYFPIPYLGMGGYFLYASSSNELQGSLNSVELGLAIKPRIPLRNAVAGRDLLITASIMLGYRGTFPEEGDATDALGLNFGLEFRVPINDRFALSLEPGFLSQPTGGNDDVFVTFDPIFYLMAGASLSL